jgi:CRISPR-associated exonuclease Cas4
MLGVEVGKGALFYGKTRRRTEVTFDAELRAIVENAAARAHALFDRGETPRVKREPKCDSCSLLEVCRPEATFRSAHGFLDSALWTALTAPVEEWKERSGI